MTGASTMLLVGESFSPWTKKARWALEQCGCKFDYAEYTPTLSEPGLRLRLRQFSGVVSVPVLFSGEATLRNSWDIAEFANRQFGRGRLGEFPDIKSWDDLSEAALAEGRAQVLRRVLASEAALEDALPSFIPTGLRRPLRILARRSVRTLTHKYAHLVRVGALRQALRAIRARIATSDAAYLTGQFSYADITMAVVLEVVAPVAVTVPPLGAALASCWRDASLTDEFQDVIAWRDRLVANRANAFSQLPSA